jgi:hypothetical protein
LIESFGIKAYQASRRISPYDDTDRAILAGYGGMAASVVIASAGIAFVWDKADDFFTRPYSLVTAQYTDSPFDTFRKSPGLHQASKVLGWAGYAYSAYEVGSAYHEGGKQGLFDYGLETVEENYRFVFPFLNTFFPE